MTTAREPKSEIPGAFLYERVYNFLRLVGRATAEEIFEAVHCANVEAARRLVRDLEERHGQEIKYEDGYYSLVGDRTLTNDGEHRTTSVVAPPTRKKMRRGRGSF